MPEVPNYTALVTDTTKPNIREFDIKGHFLFGRDAISSNFGPFKGGGWCPTFMDTHGEHPGHIGYVT